MDVKDIANIITLVVLALCTKITATLVKQSHNEKKLFEQLKKNADTETKKRKNDELIKQKTHDRAMLSILRMHLSFVYNNCRAGNKIDTLIFEDTIEVYQIYKDLGGNGLGDKMYEYILNSFNEEKTRG